MSLVKILYADLARQYVFAGQKERIPNLTGLIVKLFSPRFMPVVFFRLSHWFYQHKLSPLAKCCSLINFVVFGLEIAVRCEIGPGLYFPHTQGTVIGANRIGQNATIYHNVTLGAREVDLDYSEGARPVVCDNVILGAGAKILGAVTVGDGARVGANAVVLDDVKPGITVVGIPARPINKII